MKRNLCLDLLAQRRRGIPAGVVSLCTANRRVLSAAFEAAREDGTDVLVEATANQVNQDGGYTGMDAAAFRAFAEDAAREAGLPLERLHLGGDHLGPLVWRDRPAGEALARAETLVRSYVAAGFEKIHLDTSMRLGGDDPDAPLPVALVAARGARLCAAAEHEAASRGLERPVYVIGSEVPVPGGTTETEEGLRVTPPEEFRATVAAFRAAFLAEGLAEAWDRVVAFVVQPGVEFGDDGIHAYDRAAAAALSASLGAAEGRVFEGHSTDYQPEPRLREMVEDGVAILKVGPALTFALREGLLALSHVEEALLPRHPELVPARFPEALDAAMRANDVHWRRYAHGSEADLAFSRRFGRSDRSRYYLPVPSVQEAADRLLRNLEATGVPLTLVSQYLPTAYDAANEAGRAPDPRTLATARLRDCLRAYAAAVLPAEAPAARTGTSRTRILARPRRYDVLGVGELNLDLVLTGLRTLPVPGREVLADGFRVALGSSTAICVAGLSRLGLRTGLRARVGKDRFGEQAAEFLAQYGIDASLLLVDPTRPTGVTAALSHGGDRALVTCLGTIDALEADDVPDALLAEARHVHVGSFFLQSRLRPGLAALFQRARALGCTTSLDAGWDDTGVWDYGILDVLAETDAFLPNEGEAKAITGLDDAAAAADALARHCRVAVVKCGADGAVASAGGRTIRRGAFAGVVPVDTTGAGDSFDAGFLYGLLEGRDLDSCLAFGNACGAIRVARRGGAADFASREEALALVRTGEVRKVG